MEQYAQPPYAGPLPLVRRASLGPSEDMDMNAMPTSTAAFTLSDAPVWIQVMVAMLGSMGGAGVFRILALRMWPSMTDEAEAEATLVGADTTRAAETRMSAKDIQDFALKLMESQHERDQRTYDSWKERAELAEARADRLEAQLKVALDKIMELEVSLKGHEVVREMTDHGHDCAEHDGDDNP